MDRIFVDFSRPAGSVKPLHGTGNFARGHGADFRRASIPFCRLHDTEYPFGSGVYVDVHCVFPDMDRDPADPTAYRFYHTDRYLREIDEAGARTIYRLGESIDHLPRKTFVHPPRDPEKWAAVCEGIVAHFTEGWADGMRLDVPYWEIWNEPDNEPDPAKNPMWTGTPEQYFALYAVTARRLKRRFPHLKIGGFASCGFYAAAGAEPVPAARSSDRAEYFLWFAEEFLRRVSDPDSGAPLDFFSWHSYADEPAVNARFARYARNLLDRFGLTDCESILDEWNPRPAGRCFGLPEDGAAVFAHLCTFQREPVDAAAYYDAQPTSSYCGLFDLQGRPQPAWAAFEAFGELFRLGRCAETVCAPPLYAAAASDGTARLLAVGNLSDRPRELRFDAPDTRPVSARLLHGAAFGPAVPAERGLSLAPWQLALISFAPAKIAP